MEIEYTDVNNFQHKKTVQGTEFGTDGGYRIAPFDIIETKDMGQVVTATLYENGSSVAFVDKYSIETYCYNKTKNAPADDEAARLQAVCYALMKFNRSAAGYFSTH